MKEKKKKIVPFTIKMILLFTLLLTVIPVLSSMMYTFVNMSKYGAIMWMESIMALIMLMVMLISGNKYVFTEKRERFLTSIKKGSPILFVSILAMLGAIFVFIDEKQFNIFNFLGLILFTTGVGIFEEFLCRSWLQNEYIERFGETRKGVLRSIIISSLFFGIMHSSNVLAGQDVFNTVMQVIQTTAVGLLFGAIYYRTKNIWACIFLHGFYDFCLMLSGINELKDSVSVGGSITGIFTSIFISMIWIFAALRLLQKSDINGEIETVTEEEKIKEKKNKKLCNIMIIICFVAFFLQSFLIQDDIKIIEYKYKTKEVEEFVTHYPSYKEYNVSYTKANFESVNLKVYLKDETKLIIENINSKDSITLDYNVFQFTVIDNLNTYGVLIYTFDGDIYYGEFKKELMDNSRQYLENIKNNFKKYDIPELQQGGYITFKNGEDKYPLLLSNVNDKFAIIDGEIYVIK